METQQGYSNHENVAGVKARLLEEGREARNLIAYSLPVPLRILRSSTARSANTEKINNALLNVKNSKKLSINSKILQRKNHLRSASAGRDPQASLRARHWGFLFRNLEQAVDEIYQTAEDDQSIIECKEAILMLERYASDFRNLIEWLKIKWDYEASTEIDRPTSLTWEIRTSSLASKPKKSNTKVKRIRKNKNFQNEESKQFGDVISNNSNLHNKNDKDRNTTHLIGANDLNICLNETNGGKKENAFANNLNGEDINIVNENNLNGDNMNIVNENAEDNVINLKNGVSGTEFHDNKSKILHSSLNQVCDNKLTFLDAKNSVHVSANSRLEGSVEQPLNSTNAETSETVESHKNNEVFENLKTIPNSGMKIIVSSEKCQSKNDNIIENVCKEPIASSDNLNNNAKLATDFATNKCQKCFKKAATSIVIIDSDACNKSTKNETRNSLEVKNSANNSESEKSRNACDRKNEKKNGNIKINQKKREEIRISEKNTEESRIKDNSNLKTVEIDLKKSTESLSPRNKSPLVYTNKASEVRKAFNQNKAPVKSSSPKSNSNTLANSTSDSKISRNKSPVPSKIPLNKSPSADKISLNNSASADKITPNKLPSADKISLNKSPSADKISLNKSPSADKISLNKSPSADKISLNKSPSADKISLIKSPSADKISLNKSLSADKISPSADEISLNKVVDYDKIPLNKSFDSCMVKVQSQECQEIKSTTEVQDKRGDIVCSNNECQTGDNILKMDLIVPTKIQNNVHQKVSQNTTTPQIVKENHIKNAESNFSQNRLVNSPVVETQISSNKNNQSRNMQSNVISREHTDPTYKSKPLPPQNIKSNVSNTRLAEKYKSLQTQRQSSDLGSSRRDNYQAYNKQRLYFNRSNTTLNEKRDNFNRSNTTLNEKRENRIFKLTASANTITVHHMEKPRFTNHDFKNPKSDYRNSTSDFRIPKSDYKANTAESQARCKSALPGDRKADSEVNRGYSECTDSTDHTSEVSSIDEDGWQLVRKRRRSHCFTNNISFMKNRYYETSSTISMPSLALDLDQEENLRHSCQENRKNDNNRQNDHGIERKDRIDGALNDKNIGQNEGKIDEKEKFAKNAKKQCETDKNVNEKGREKKENQEKINQNPIKTGKNQRNVSQSNSNMFKNTPKFKTEKTVQSNTKTAKVNLLNDMSNKSKSSSKIDFKAEKTNSFGDFKMKKDVNESILKKESSAEKNLTVKKSHSDLSTKKSAKATAEILAKKDVQLKISHPICERKVNKKESKEISDKKSETKIEISKKVVGKIRDKINETNQTSKTKEKLCGKANSPKVENVEVSKFSKNKCKNNNETPSINIIDKKVRSVSENNAISEKEKKVEDEKKLNGEVLEINDEENKLKREIIKTSEKRNLSSNLNNEGKGCLSSGPTFITRENSRSKLKKSQSEIDSLKAEFDQRKADFDSLQAKYDESKIEGSIQAEFDQPKAEFDSLQAEFDESKAELGLLQADLDVSTDMLDESRDDFDIYEGIPKLSTLSWADQMDVFDEIESIRPPGRVLHIHERLSSPSRKLSIPEKYRRHQEKLAKAEELREKIFLEKTERIKGMFKKIDDANTDKERMLIEKRDQFEKKMERAEENRRSRLQEIVNRAHDEDNKAKEIAFINGLEAQNKMLDIRQQHESHDARLADIAEERNRKQEEKAAKEAAAQERRRIMEEDRKARMKKIWEKSCERFEKIDRQQAEKKEELLEQAREKARDREERLTALQQAQLAKETELERKIQQKLEETRRRHEENIEQIRQKAFESSIMKYSQGSDEAPQLTNYETKRFCTLCNYVILSEVYLLSHIRSGKHLEAISNLQESHVSAEESKSYNLKYIIDAPADLDETKMVKEEEQRHKTLKKRAKKVKSRFVTVSKSFLENYLAPDPENSGYSSKKFQKGLQQIEKMISKNGTDTWPSSDVTSLNRIGTDLLKTLDNSKDSPESVKTLKNPKKFHGFVNFEAFNGFNILFSVFNLINLDDKVNNNKTNEISENINSNKSTENGKNIKSDNNNKKNFENILSCPLSLETLTNCAKVLLSACSAADTKHSETACQYVLLSSLILKVPELIIHRFDQLKYASKVSTPNSNPKGPSLNSNLRAKSPCYHQANLPSDPFLSVLIKLLSSVLNQGVHNYAVESGLGDKLLANDNFHKLSQEIQSSVVDLVTICVCLEIPDKICTYFNMVQSSIENDSEASELIYNCTELLSSLTGVLCRSSRSNLEKNVNGHKNVIDNETNGDKNKKVGDNGVNGKVDNSESLSNKNKKNRKNQNIKNRENKNNNNLEDQEVEICQTANENESVKQDECKNKKFKNEEIETVSSVTVSEHQENLNIQVKTPSENISNPKSIENQIKPRENSLNPTILNKPVKPSLPETKVNPVNKPKKTQPDSTHLIETFRILDGCGVVSLMYGLLLYQGGRSPSPPIAPVLSQSTLNICEAATKFLISLAELNLTAFQEILGGEGISLEMRHIASFLFWYCSIFPFDDLLHNVIILVGYFTVDNRDNQEIIQSGENPSVLQQMCSLPWNYFCYPKLSDILMPSLLACSLNNARNIGTVKKEMSYEILEEYLQKNNQSTNPLMVKIVATVAKNKG